MTGSVGLLIVIAFSLFYANSALKRRYSYRKSREQLLEQIRCQQQRSLDAINEKMVADNVGCIERQAVYATLRLPRSHRSGR